MAENRHQNEQRPHRSGRNLATIFLIASALILIVAFISWYPAFLLGAGKTAYIKIPHGATLESLEDSIAKYEGESYASHVIRLIRVRHTDLGHRTGAYQIKEGQTPFSSMRMLTSGGQTPIRLTITGSRDMKSLATRLAAKLATSPDSLYAAMTDPQMLASHGLHPDDTEALFFNDSYDVYWTDSPKEIVRKIAQVFDNRWNPQRRKKAEELGLTPREVMIISSIVDEETNAIDEKGQVARVYINRLNSGMKLQSDPTVRYALNDFTIRRVTNEHLKVDSPYNTYMYPGLPPGPIRTTSIRTVDEVLESTPSFDIYMCARDDFSGRHNFAATYEQHQENARRYRQALDARGIH